jgi:hypothetical protein
MEKLSHNKLGLKKISASWVPKTLTARQHVLVETNLAVINKDPNEFLKNVFSVNEIWVHHYDPE